MTDQTPNYNAYVSHPLVEEAFYLFMRINFNRHFSNGKRKARLKALKRRAFKRVERRIQLFSLNGQV